MNLRRLAMVLVAWLGLWAICVALRSEFAGRVSRRSGAPLYAEFDPRWIALALVVGGTAMFAGYWLHRRSSTMAWPRLLLATAALAFVWAVALNAVDDPNGLTRGVAGEHEPYAVLDEAQSPRDFLAEFSERVETLRYPIHVQGHPPGNVLALRALEAIGLRGPGAAAGLALAGVPLAAFGVMLTARRLGGEATARRSAVFVALAPTAIWMAASNDALYAGIGALAVAAAVGAIDSPPTRSESNRRGDFVTGAGAGLLLGVGLMLSYGLASVALAIGGYALWRRRIVVGVVIAMTATAVLGAFVPFGFRYWEGLAATRHAYESGLAAQRPYSLYLAANLAAFGIALGPVAVAGLGGLRRDRASATAALGFGLAMVAAVSGLSKGEVERIWLPFAVFAVTSAALVARPARLVVPLVGVQVAFAVVVVSLYRTPW